MRISDWSSDVCSSDLPSQPRKRLPLCFPWETARVTSFPLPHLGHAFPCPSRGGTSAFGRSGHTACRHAVGSYFRDRQSVVSGKSWALRVDIGGSGLIKTQKTNK